MHPALPAFSTLSPGKPIPGSRQAVKKNRQLFPGPSQASPSSRGVATGPRRREAARFTRHAKCRDVNLLPFRARPRARRALLARRGGGRSSTDFPCLLGPTHPWPTAVAMEPFSPSAFKVLT